jgi:hypothetical protein
MRRRSVDYATYCTYAAVAWGVLYPHPYGLAMLVLGAIPVVVIALAVRRRDAYTLDSRGGDRRHNLSAALILPGLVLAYRAASDQEVLDWQPTMWWTAIITIAFAVVVYWVAPELRARKFTLALFVLILAAYGYGAPAMVNMAMDASSPQVFATRVLGKHSTSGRSRTYYLDLAPWGPRTEHGDVTVRGGFYTRAAEGRTVCVYLFAGALGARWFVTDDCPRE